MKNIFIIVLLLSVISYSQTSRFVSKDGSSQFPYSTWETACDSIRPVVEIADSGDTIYIGAGVFIDTLDITKELVILGQGKDETTINCDRLRNEMIIVHGAKLTMKGITLLGSETTFLLDGSSMISTYGLSNIYVEDCVFSNTYIGIINLKGNAKIKNCIFKTSHRMGVLASISNDISYSRNIIDGCVFMIEKGRGHVMRFEGRYLEFKNNICLNSLASGIYNITCDTVIVENNIMSTEESALKLGHCRGKVRVVNNIFHNGLANQYSPAIFISKSPKVEIHNNIVYRYPQAVELRNAVEWYNIDYNCLYENTHGFDDTVSVGENNIELDPMWIKSPLGPEQPDEFDLRLQKYSPCIDTGNPDILDVDGTRSDIGLFGGPFGMVYNYEDLPTEMPKNIILTTINDSTFQIDWDANTESDFAGYKIYMGENSTFEPSVNNLISVTDTNTYILQENYTENKYIKITSYDNQGNESESGEVLSIIVTGEEIRGEKEYEYKLFQNYPNPFNPQTNIRFALKSEGIVKIKVFDLKGEMIFKEKGKHYPAGGHEIELNLSNYASGIYIVTLQVEQNGKPIFVDNKKITLLK
ncbi:MAG: hypothetical protein SCALA702_00780 [Melioribacteraceae bacterium]|nr:MAG: hypothetical protein SCALA702_00780 [Melioribacteraceae bacterium]